jgi:hypothetical protein
LQPIELDVNGTSYTLTTDPDGYATQPLNLIAVGGQTTTYQIQALFEGAGFKTRNLTVTDPYGQDHLVCTTLQWDFKASQNSVTLTVEAPKTDTTSSTSDEGVTVTQDGESTTATIPPAKTPEQMQAEAGSLGLQSWGPDSFSIFPPFMKFHARVVIDWLGMDVHSWIGLGACGIDSYTGFGRLLEEGFENVPIDMVDVINSAFISSIAATTTLFITSLIAATFTSITPAYVLTLLAYSMGGAALLFGFYALANYYIARAVLFGVGATLLSLLIGVISTNTLVRSIPFMVRTELSGAEPVRLAVKSLVNTLVNNYLGATSIVSKAIFANPLMIPFALATAGLAVWALYLGWARR